MAVKAKAQITLSYIIDVKAYYRYYKLQSSTSTTPSVPTAFPPSGWTDAEPSYTSGSTNSLYFVDCTVFCDDSFSYSAVSLSTSYEAAKEAYNKADNAQNSVDNIEIGGTNLIVSSILTTGYRLNASGEEYASTYSSLSVHFSVTSGREMTYSVHRVHTDEGDTYWQLAFYTEDGVCISRPVMYQANTTVDKTYWTVVVPSNAVTARVAFPTSAREYVKLEYGNQATDWSPAPEDLASSGRMDELDNVLNDVDGRLDDLANTTQSNKESLDSAWEIVEVNKQQIADLLQENGEITMNFATLSTTVSELNGAYKTDYDERIKYIKFVDGEIWLGKEKESDTENDFKVVISNTKISFLQNGTEVAYISNNKLYISEAHITKSLRIGHFETTVRANGNVGTYWVDD